MMMVLIDFLKGIEVLELQIMIQTELMDRIRLELEILAIQIGRAHV